MNMPSRPQADSGFTWPIRVYYEDTDAGGIVFYANYLKYFERARTEWLRACGVDQRKLADESRILFVVSRTTLEYRAPARLDDLLTIKSRVARLGHASIEFAQEAWRGDVLLATGDIRVGCVDGTLLKATALPPAILAALERGPEISHINMSTAHA
jgi:acyl-CoA thioester hydrolase